MFNKHAITQLLHFLLKDEGQMRTLHSGSIKNFVFKTAPAIHDLKKGANKSGYDNEIYKSVSEASSNDH